MFRENDLLDHEAFSTSASSDGPTLSPTEAHADLQELLRACAWEPSTSVTLKVRPMELDSLRALAMSAAMDPESGVAQQLERHLQPQPLPRIEAEPPSLKDTVKPPAMLRRAAAIVSAKAPAPAKAKSRRRTKSTTTLARAS